MPIDFSDPEVQAELKAAGMMNQEQIKSAGYMTSTDVTAAGYVSKDDLDAKIKEANQGLEANRDNILEQLSKAKEANKQLNESVAGIDLEAAKEWQKKLNEDELAKLVAAGDVESLKKRFTTPYEQQMADIQAQAAQQEQEKLKAEKELNEKLSAALTQAKQTDIKSRVNTAISEIRDTIQPTAVDDIARLAMDVCDLNEEGKLVIKDANGVARQTDKGDMTLAEYMAQLVTDKPHFFTGAQGGGGRKAVIQDKGPGGQKLTAKQRLELKRSQGK